MSLSSIHSCRFGTVKSVNVAKVSSLSITPQTYDVVGDIASVIIDGVKVECDDRKKQTEVLEDVDHHDSGKVGRSEHSRSRKEYEEVNTDVDGKSSYDEKLDRLELLSREREPKDGDEVVEGNSTCEDKLVDNLVDNQACQPAPVDKDIVVEDRTCQESSCAIPAETANQLNSSIDKLEIHDNIVMDSIQKVVPEVENNSSVKEETKLEENNMSLEGASSDLDHSLRGQIMPVKVDDNKEQESEQGDIEPGCVLVEFRRTEAACMAAHCLHGRLFDERIVTVGYVNLDLYQARFPKK